MQNQAPPGVTLMSVNERECVHVHTCVQTCAVTAAVHLLITVQ